VRRYELDGRRIGSLEDFYAEVSRVLIPDRDWGRNLDAFNDILAGGFGTPKEGFVVVVRGATHLRSVLGHAAVVDRWRRLLRDGVVHPTNRAHVRTVIRDAELGQGPTLFDELIEIIRSHGPGGEDAQDNVLLEVLE
jgi:RNAse (barnase) inhibitor barstar